MKRLDSDPPGTGGPGLAAWSAMALALLGRWVHAFAQGWLMFQLTGSALWLAAAAALAALSALPLAWLSGTRLANCPPSRRLVLAYGGLILVALACAGLLVSGRLSPWQLLLAAAAYGGLAAVEAPALAAVVGASASVAGRQACAARFALLFNGMRILAPALAAALIAGAGVAACFVFNAVCLVPILVLALRFPPSWRPSEEESQLAKGQALFRPRALLASAAVFSALVLPTAALLPAIAHEAGGDPLALLSRLSSGLGAGALGSALLLCRWRPISAVRGGLVLAGLALLASPGLGSPALQLTWSLTLGAAISGVLGLCVSELHGLRQHRLRARALAAYAAIQLGLTPLAVLVTALLAEALGTTAVLQAAGALLLAYAAFGHGLPCAGFGCAGGVASKQKFSDR